MNYKQEAGLELSSINLHVYTRENRDKIKGQITDFIQ